MSVSFNASKLRSPTAAPKTTTVSSVTQPFCICPNCNHFITFNHHLEPSTTNTGFHVQSQQSSRWSPTPAQLLYLEELYKHGTRTPTAEQIQQIASQLRRFGKIEGKNVFYWFQNHKARERQKRRRLEMDAGPTAASSAREKELHVMGSSEKQLEAAGLIGTGHQIKETRKSASASNCSGLAEEPASLDKAERGVNVWAQIEEREMLVLGRDKAERRGECHNIEDTTLNARDLTPQSYNLPFVPSRESFNHYDKENEDTDTLELFPPERDINQHVKFFEFLPLKN